MNFRAHHLLFALVLHGLLFLLLAVGVKCTPAIAPPRVIQGVLLDPNREQQARAAQQRATEQERIKQEQLKLEREVQEAKTRAEAEAARKQAERQKTEQEKLKKKQELESRKKKDDLAKKAADAERKTKDEQKRKQQEQQKALEKTEQELRNRQLQADAEAAEQDVSRRKANDALEEWIALVSARVKGNWLRPPDASEQFTCVVQIEQLPGGQIINRKMVQSCGNRLLDDSVLKAVDKSNPLPLVTNPAAFNRTFSFKFCPSC